MSRAAIRHRRRYLGGTVFLVASLGLIVSRAWGTRSSSVQASVQSIRVESTASPLDLPAADDLASYDATELLRLGLERCVRQVSDYRCVFVRQEQINGTLTAEQAVRVLYRDEPRSVHMTWIRNADRVRRAVYVKGRHVGADGQELAVVEPAGAIARLIVGELKIPIHGEQARRTSRHSIDQFGFRATLERITRDNQRFAEEGALDCRRAGEGMIADRPTYVLIRHLPYTGPEGKYPDARQVVHLDQQWLVPLAVYSYADHREQELLGSYVTTQVELNHGLDAAAFAG